MVKNKALKISLKIFACIFVGVANGLFGGGGGMVAVPMLMCLFMFKEKEAHATTILIILLSSISTIIGYSIKMPQIYTNWPLMLAIGAGVIGGGVLGTFCLKKLNTKILQKCFAVLMLVAGIFMIFR